MSRVAVAVLLSLLFELTAAQVLPVQVKSPTGQEGMGFVVARQSVCVVVTAAHVVGNQVDVTLMQAGKRFGATVLWSGARAAPATDVAILAPRETLPVTCRYLPDASALEDSLIQPVGQLWVVSATGEVLTPRVTIARRTPSELTLAVLDEPERFIVGGVSGAAVTFDGRIVAVVSGNENRQLVAERLDAILRRGASGLAAPEARPQDVAQPFDLSRIAARYSGPAQRARAVREQAERVSKLARDVERLSDEAARLAEELPLGQVSQGHSRFSATNGNFYAGQVSVRSGLLSSSTTASSSGFGVSRQMTGDGKGRVVKCSFRGDGKGCQGPSVVEWPSGGWKRAEGEYVEDALMGPGYVVFHNGVICFGSLKVDPDGNGLFGGEGVMIQANGRRFEGQLGSNCQGHGFGVLWEKDGSLVRAGRWRDGQPVDD